MYIYLDESGDLGTKIKEGRSSRYFLATAIVFDDFISDKRVSNAVKVTVKRKFTRSKQISELKGVYTTIGVKKYFYNLIKEDDIKIFSLVFDKQEFLHDILRDKNRFYDKVFLMLIEKILNNSQIDKVRIFLDKSKKKHNISRFNKAVMDRFLICNSIVITHDNSRLIRNLQVCDLFSNGIFQKYENGKNEWFEVFESKVVLEEKVSLESQQN